MLELSVLDYVPVYTETVGASAVDDLDRLAQLPDRAEYARYGLITVVSKDGLIQQLI